MITIKKQPRLLQRIAKIARNNKAIEDVPVTKRNIHVCFKNPDGELETKIIPFTELINTVGKSEFFTGYIDNKVRFYSSLFLILTKPEYTIFEQAFSKYSFTSYKQVLNEGVNVILPLADDVYDQDEFNKLIKSINFTLKSKINVSFDHPIYSKIFTDEKVVTNDQEALVASKYLIDLHVRQLQQLKSQKNKEKANVIKEGLYRVKRLTKDTDVSKEPASLLNVCNFILPKKLKAPFTLDEVFKYSMDSGVCAALAVGLGINEKYIKPLAGGQYTSEKFGCLINQKSDACLYICKDLESKYYGKITYKALKNNKRYSMHELYAAMTNPDNDFNKPTLMTLLLKILDDAGLIDKSVEHLDTPSGLTTAEKEVFFGFKQLSQLKHSVKGQEGDGIVYTNTFAAMWCGVSRITATKAIKKLIALSVIQILEDTSKFVMYLFTQVNQTIINVIDEIKQTVQVKTVIAQSFKGINKNKKIGLTKDKSINNIGLENIGLRYMKTLE
jgi:hypothetical protein